MARLTVVAGELIVQLSNWEKLGAFRGDVHVRLGAIRTVRVSADPWSELRGVRAPGTGIPKVIALGTRRGRGIVDFAAVYKAKPAVVVEAEGARFQRVVVSAVDAPGDARRISVAAGLPVTSQ